MGNIRRRIEALQRATSDRRDDSKATANKALEWLGSEEVELLISAWGATRARPALSEYESPVRQAYTQALRREYQWARLVAARSFEHSGYLHHAILITLAQRCSPEELKLLPSALCRTQQGGEPTAQESAAVQIQVLEMERLCHLAGFGSTPKLDALGCRAAGCDR